MEIVITHDCNATLKRTTPAQRVELKAGMIFKVSGEYLHKYRAEHNGVEFTVAKANAAEIQGTGTALFNKEEI